MDEALAGSPTLKIAHARTRKALAFADVSKAALYPQVNADAEITREGFVACGSSQRDPKINPRLNAAPCLRHSGGAQPYVVGILHRADEPAAIDRDVELAREIVELAMVQNKLCQFMREGERVENFVRIEPSRWVRRKIPDACGDRGPADSGAPTDLLRPRRCALAQGRQR